MFFNASHEEAKEKKALPRRSERLQKLLDEFNSTVAAPQSRQQGPNDEEDEKVFEVGSPAAFRTVCYVNDDGTRATVKRLRIKSPTKSGVPSPKAKQPVNTAAERVSSIPRAQEIIRHDPVDYLDIRKNEGSVRAAKRTAASSPKRLAQQTQQQRNSQGVSRQQELPALLSNREESTTAGREDLGKKQHHAEEAQSLQKDQQAQSSQSATLNPYVLLLQSNIDPSQVNSQILEPFRFEEAGQDTANSPYPAGETRNVSARPWLPKITSASINGPISFGIGVEGASGLITLDSYLQSQSHKYEAKELIQETERRLTVIQRQEQTHRMVAKRQQEKVKSHLRELRAQFAADMLLQKIFRHWRRERWVYGIEKWKTFIIAARRREVELLVLGPFSVKIQRRFRKSMAHKAALREIRKKIAYESSKAAVIQCAFRQYAARETGRRLFYEKKVTTVQKLIRGYLARLQVWRMLREEIRQLLRAIAPQGRIYRLRELRSLSVDEREFIAFCIDTLAGEHFEGPTKESCDALRHLLQQLLFIMERRFANWEKLQIEHVRRRVAMEDQKTRQRIQQELIANALIRSKIRESVELELMALEEREQRELNHLEAIAVARARIEVKRRERKTEVKENSLMQKAEDEGRKYLRELRQWMQKRRAMMMESQRIAKIKERYREEREGEKMLREEMLQKYFLEAVQRREEAEKKAMFAQERKLEGVERQKMATEDAAMGNLMVEEKRRAQNEREALRVRKWREQTQEKRELMLMEEIESETREYMRQLRLKEETQERKRTVQRLRKEERERGLMQKEEEEGKQFYRAEKQYLSWLAKIHEEEASIMEKEDKRSADLRSLLQKEAERSRTRERIENFRMLMEERSQRDREKSLLNKISKPNIAQAVSTSMAAPRTVQQPPLISVAQRRELQLMRREEERQRKVLRQEQVRLEREQAIKARQEHFRRQAEEMRRKVAGEVAAKSIQAQPESSPESSLPLKAPTPVQEIIAASVPTTTSPEIEQPAAQPTATESLPAKMDRAEQIPSNPISMKRQPSPTVSEKRSVYTQAEKDVCRAVGNSILNTALSLALQKASVIKPLYSLQPSGLPSLTPNTVTAQETSPALSGVITLEQEASRPKTPVDRESGLAQVGEISAQSQEPIATMVRPVTPTITVPSADIGTVDGDNSRTATPGLTTPIVKALDSKVSTPDESTTTSAEAPAPQQINLSVATKEESPSDAVPSPLPEVIKKPSRPANSFTAPPEALMKLREQQLLGKEGDEGGASGNSPKKSKFAYKLRAAAKVAKSMKASRPKPPPPQPVNPKEVEKMNAEDIRAGLRRKREAEGWRICRILWDSLELAMFKDIAGWHWEGWCHSAVDIVVKRYGIPEIYPLRLGNLLKAVGESRKSLVQQLEMEEKRKESLDEGASNEDDDSSLPTLSEMMLFDLTSGSEILEIRDIHTLQKLVKRLEKVYTALIAGKPVDPDVPDDVIGISRLLGWCYIALWRLTYDRSHCQSAVRVLFKAAELQKDQKEMPEQLVLLARAYEEGGRHVKALDALAKLIQSFPRFKKIRKVILRAAIILKHVKKTAESVKYLVHVMDNPPPPFHTDDIQLQLARLYDLEGSEDMAQAGYSEAFSSRWNRAGISGTGGHDNYKDWIMDGDVWVSEAETYHEMGEFALASDALSMAAHKCKEHPPTTLTREELLLKLASMYFLTNDQEKLMEEIGNALTAKSFEDRTRAKLALATRRKV